LTVAERTYEVADRRLDEPGQRSPVGHLDLDARLVLRDAGVAERDRTLPHSLDRRVVDRRIRVFLNARFAADEPDCGAMVDGELPLKSLGDVLLVTQVQYERRDMQPN